MKKRLAYAVILLTSLPGILPAAGLAPEELVGIRTQLGELAARLDRLEAENAYLREQARATRRELAEADVQLEKLPALDRSVRAAEWAGRLRWRGDLRLRTEKIDAEEDTDARFRQRVRVRAGFDAKVTETVSAVVQLGTTGGNGDPRSTNQTLGEGFTRKGLGLDLAYAQWQPSESIGVRVGKQPYPFERVPSAFWDGDITWEGAALRASQGPWFGSAYGFWLDESAGADANVLGGQVGLHLGERYRFTGALGYTRLGAVQGEIVATSVMPACVASPAFFGGSQGNFTDPVNGCARLRNAFGLIESLAQLEVDFGHTPVMLFANHIHNQRASDEDTGYALGFTVGRASAPRSFEFGYLFQDMEKDAQFGQFVDSDFAGGITGARGSMVRFGFAAARGWVIAGTWLDNERLRGNDPAISPVRDYQRWMLDLNFRY